MNSIDEVGESREFRFTRSDMVFAHEYKHQTYYILGTQSFVTVSSWRDANGNCGYSSSVFCSDSPFADRTFTSKTLEDVLDQSAQFIQDWYNLKDEAYLQ